MKRLFSIFLIMFAWSASALTNGFSKPYMGWNPYYYYGSFISAQIVTNQAQAMSTNGMLAAGYNYVILDAQWSDGTTNSQGVPNPDATRFPQGISGTADYVHSLGMMQGVYCSGDVTSNGTHEAIGGSWTNAMNQFAAWKQDFVKFDFIDQFTYDGSLLSVTNQIVKMWGAVMSCGRPIIYNIVSPPVLSWHFQWANSSRTSADSSGAFSDVLSRADDFNAIASSYGSGSFPDPDYLQINVASPLLSTTEQRSQFALWCVMGAPLVLGGNATNLTATQLTLLTQPELIAIDQDGLVRPGTRVSRTAGYGGNMDVWVKPIWNGYAVGCVNGTGGATNFTVDFSGFGLTTNYAYLRDAFNRTNVGWATNTFSVASVASHDTAVFTLTNAVSSPRTIHANTLRVTGTMTYK